MILLGTSECSQSLDYVANNVKKPCIPSAPGQQSDIFGDLAIPTAPELQYDILGDLAIPLAPDLQSDIAGDLAYPQSLDYNINNPVAFSFLIGHY